MILFRFFDVQNSRPPGGFLCQFLKTKESLGTGASYGDATVNGTTIGIGFKGQSENGLQAKWVW